MSSYLQALLLLLLCSSALSSTILPRTNSPTAKTAHASYVGLNYPARNADVFLGVRYAQPPIGPLRLQAPQLYDAKGTITSQAVGNQCFQISTSGQNQSEDCLFLNIVTPAQASTKHSGKHSGGLPVMLWIHGGGFNDGSGNLYDPLAIVNRSVELKSPVIVVTINYRLSFFGFSGRPFLTSRVVPLTFRSGKCCRCQWRFEFGAS